MKTITLLANTQVVSLEIKCSTFEEAVKIAKNEMQLMGYTNVSVIGQK